VVNFDEPSVAVDFFTPRHRHYLNPVQAVREPLAELESLTVEAADV